jgi:hypothetical protein
MTQPRPNADQVRRRFSASAVASALVVEFSGAGVCLGAIVLKNSAVRLMTKY